MKAVLISIQPKWCELIASGKKTVEVRKTKPKLDTPFKVHIYCTKQGNRFFHGGIGEKECLFKNPDTKEIKFDFTFELMCCKNEYTNDNFLSGKVIGEFVCNKITDCRDINGQAFFTISRMSLKEWMKYTEGHKGTVWAWHISDLVIYDKPKELSEFITPTDCNSKIAKDMLCNTCCLSANFCSKKPKRITRPPQSWCYVESGVAAK